MKNLFNTFNKLLLVDGLFEGGRMFAGATSVTYLLQSGLSLKNIALLKSVQAIVVIIAELPTGILADALGRRLSLIVSIILSIIGFSLFFLGSHLNTFILAEVLTALALCLWSGAFEAFAIDKAHLTDKTIDEFFHINSTINSLLVLIFGLLGGWLGSHGLNWPYLGAIIAFIFLLLTLLNISKDSINNINLFSENQCWLKNTKYALKHQFHQHIKLLLSKELFKKGILVFILLQICIQFLIQPLLHYWQPFFSNLDSKIGPTELGYIFAAYSGTSVIFGIVASFLTQKHWFRTTTLTWVLFMISSIVFIYLSTQPNLLLSLFLFAILQGLISMARTSLSARMNSKISNESRASVLSFISLISRLGMIMSLTLLSSLHTPQTMFQIYAILSSVVSLLIGCILINPYLVTTTKLLLEHVAKLNSDSNLKEASSDYPKTTEIT